MNALTTDISGLYDLTSDSVEPKARTVAEDLVRMLQGRGFPQQGVAEIAPLSTEEPDTGDDLQLRLKRTLRAAVDAQVPYARASRLQLRARACDNTLHNLGRLHAWSANP